jgi:hypothetical protein
MDLVRITWIDSHSPNMNLWVPREDIDHELLEIDTVGFVLHECKKSVTLASQIALGNSASVAGVITVPKVCIKKRKKLSNG